MNLEEVSPANSGEDAANLLNEPHIQRHFTTHSPDVRHNHVTASKSPHTHISLGASADPATADVTLTSIPSTSIKDNISCKLQANHYLLDCKSLPAMELRRKYKATADSHRNMLRREKMAGAVIHPDFVDFRSFLAIVGPRPGRNFTLDRIDNNDPEYAPAKVRWATKRT